MRKFPYTALSEVRVWRDGKVVGLAPELGHSGVTGAWVST